MDHEIVVSLFLAGVNINDPSTILDSCCIHQTHKNHITFKIMMTRWLTFAFFAMCLQTYDEFQSVIYMINRSQALKSENGDIFRHRQGSSHILHAYPIK